MDFPRTGRGLTSPAQGLSRAGGGSSLGRHPGDHVQHSTQGTDLPGQAGLVAPRQDGTGRTDPVGLRGRHQAWAAVDGHRRWGGQRLGDDAVPLGKLDEAVRGGVV